METEKKKEMKRIGIYVDVSRGEGGSFQYIQFILDAAVDAQAQYKCDFIIIFIEQTFAEILKERYKSLKMKRIEASRADIPDAIDYLGLDIVFVPLSTVTCWIGADLKTPLISVIHDVNPFYYKDYYENGIKMTGAIMHLFQKVVRKSIGVFVDSELGKKELTDAVGKLYEDKIYPLPFRAPDYLDKGMPEEIIELKNEKFIFYPAQFWPQKNFVNLIVALESLKEDGITVNILFTGSESSERARIERLVNKLGLSKQVQFSGHVTDAQMKYLYEKARGMVFSSYHGPTNIPLYEAMYMGCPMAVSNIRYMPWQAEDAALYFDPRYPDSIAEAVKKIWLEDNTCSILAEKGKKRYSFFEKEHFNARFRHSLFEILKADSIEGEIRKSILSFCSQHRNVLLYGAGEYSSWMLKYLKMEGIIPRYILVSEEKGFEKFGGTDILALGQDTLTDNESGIIICTNNQYHKEILSFLKNNGIDEKDCLCMNYSMYEALIEYVSDRT